MSDDLSTLLRERVADARPDLDRLVRVATTQGTRIRRVRRAGVALGSAAVVAAVAVAATQLGGRTPHAADPGFAAGGPAAPVHVHVGQVVALPGGGTARVVRALSAVSGRPHILVRVRGTKAQIGAFERSGAAWLRRQYPHDALLVALPTHRTAANTTTSSAKAPIDLEGWSCQWTVADEKGICDLAGTAGVAVNWRPAGEHAAYLDPAKADVIDGVHTYVSPVHGKLFVTIAPSPGVTQDEIDAAASALVWR